LKRFSLQHRIRKKKDFLTLRRDGKKLVARHWILFFCKNDLTHPRLATSISTRYGTAVARNRLRRWLREKIRLHVDELGSFDLHFVAKASRSDKSWKEYEHELSEDFERLLRKLPV
jgi:ribonuclease P protein component